jgi:hypothetical protein
VFSTEQQFEFELVGIGEEPLAQNHFVLECQAKKSIENLLEVVTTSSVITQKSVFFVIVNS